MGHPKNGLTLLLLNTSNQTKFLKLPNNGDYVKLSSNDLYSQKLYANGKLIKSLDHLKKIIWQTTKDKKLSIDKFSYIFLRLKNSSVDC